jgi:predicted DNA-binding transcriptional regulator AlpA
MSTTRERLSTTAQAHEQPHNDASRDVRGTTPRPPNLPTDILWGVRAIAEYVNRTERQAYHLVATGALPARKIGPRLIVARRSEIDRVISSQEAAPR